MRIFLLLSVLVAASATRLQAAGDTLVMDLSMATSRLLSNNLELMAERYSIDIAEAEKLQAGYWPNPTLIWNSDLYSLERNQYFNFRNQKLIQIEVMAPLSGRRFHAKNVAAAIVEIRKAEFEDFNRELVSGFQKLCVESEYKRHLLTNYEELMPLFERTLQSATERSRQGMIPYSEVLRLEAEWKSLLLDFTNLKMEFLDLQSQLRILLGVKENVFLRFTLEYRNADLPALDSLVNHAISERPDVKMLQWEVIQHQREVRLAKANMLGDVKMGFQPHDKGSNYVRPYSGLVIEVPLPVFNRNTGSQKIARYQIETTKIMQERKVIEVRQQISSTYEKLKLNETEFRKFNPETNQEMKDLLKKAGENYSAKLIDILEYLDIQRMYLQMTDAYLGMQSNQLTLKIELEYYSASKL